MKDTNNTPFQYSHKRVLTPKDLGIVAPKQTEVKKPTPVIAPKKVEEPVVEPEKIEEPVIEPEKVEIQEEKTEGTLLADAGFCDNSIKRLELNDIYTVEELEAYIEENGTLLPLKKIAEKSAELIMSELNAYRQAK